MTMMTMMEVKEVQSVQSHEEQVWTVAWHSGGRMLATGSTDKLIKIWGEGPSGEEGK